MAANIGGSHNDAFSQGLNHQRNETGHANDFTLSDTGSLSDPGLQDSSARFNDLVPHGVVSQQTTGGNDTGFEPLERESGSYTPGSMESMQDKLSDGSNDNQP
jgi:hypothetical protein